MKKIAIFIFSIILVSGSAVATETSTVLKKIENYLNSLTSISSDFIQINNDGSVNTGKFFLQKPLKMRFEYDPPAKHIIMINGSLLVIIDKTSNSEPQRFPTSMTPLSFLGKPKLDLINSIFLKEFFTTNENTLHILLFNPKNEKSGQLELIFTDNPISLSEWIVTNYSNERIKILLEELRVNDEIEKSKFNIGKEITTIRRKLQSPQEN